MKKYLILLSILIIGFVFCKKCAAQTDNASYVILVSFDGFRHDYVENFDTPNFKAFINKGVAAKSLIPSFPSKTFPNHYSIVTGMYPGNHGLVDNSFFDPKRKTTYSMKNRVYVQDAYYYGGLPLWQLAQKNKMKTASFFWVGSEAPISGSYPDYYHIYDGSIPNEKRINTVKKWLELPSKDRPQLVTLYFSLVDSQGHTTGPNSKETEQVVLEADRLLGLLMKEVNSIPLNINVILTSDHGMYEMESKPETYIYSDDILEGIDVTSITYVSNSTHAHMFVANQTLRNDVYSKIKTKEDNFKIYKKEETPERWHYRDSERIGDLLLVAKPGHIFTSKDNQLTTSMTSEFWGVHGFDPYTTPEMGGIFYAKGPSIKEGLKIDSFENVNIYPIVCEILGIQPPDNIDGNLSILLPILRK